MKLLHHKGTRTCVSACLLLALFALVAVDVTVCCGDDGHMGFGTPLGSTCCPSEESTCCPSDDLAPPACHAFTTALAPGSDGFGCVDIPLIKVAPVCHPEEMGSVDLAQPSVILVADPAHASLPRAIHPHLQSLATLLQLRSTTLLI